MSQAVTASQEMAEAELWEQIQIILVDAYGQDLEGEELAKYCNEQFDSQDLEAIMSYRVSDDTYIVTYGVYSKTVAYLDANLSVINTVSAVVADSSLWKWSIDTETGTATLTEYLGDMSGDIVIPNIVEDEDYGGCLVTAINQYLFDSEEEITSVTFNEGLESIGQYAFYYCTGLDCTIIFPSTLTSIGAYAFTGCTGIVANISDIVAQGITLGKNCFSGCSGITGDIADLMTTLDSDTTVISAGMFAGFSGVTGNLVIPARITSIEEGAFQTCTGISSISVEENSQLTYIGVSAFASCTGVKSLTFGDAPLVTIDDSAFESCTAIASDLAFPTTLVTIGSSAFKSCTNLAAITFNTGLTTIGQEAFRSCSKLKGTSTITSTTTISNALEIPYTVTSISAHTFRSCVAIPGLIFASGGKDAGFGDTLTIGTYAFSECTAIAEIVFPTDRSTTISGTYAFNGCTALTTISNALTITQVANYGFQSCSKLTTMPSQTKSTTIGDYAYYGCTNLGYEEDGYDSNAGYLNIITWLQNSVVKTVGASAFGGCKYLGGSYSSTATLYNSTTPKSEITLGAGWYDSITQVVAATEIEVEDDGKTLTWSSSSITSSDGFNGATSLVAVIDSKQTEITELIIPEEVTSIGTSAFAGCTAITSIEFKSTSIAIGDYAFYRCTNLKTVTFAKGIVECTNENLKEDAENIESYDTEDENFHYYGETWTGYLAKSIGIWAFNYCTSLISITWPENLNYVPDRCFDGCRKLEGFTFGSNLTSIGSYAFCWCKISSNLAFNCVTSFGACAFWQCSAMSSLYFSPDLITIGFICFYGCSALEFRVVLPDSVESVGYGAFKESGILGLEFSGAGTSISIGTDEWGLCSGCSSLEEVVLPTTVTTIGYYEFYNCSSLTSITWSDGEDHWSQIEEIQSKAFYGCTSLNQTITLSSTCVVDREDVLGGGSILTIKVSSN